MSTDELPPENRRDFMRKSMSRFFRISMEASGNAPEPPPVKPRLPADPPTGAQPRGTGSGAAGGADVAGGTGAGGTESAAAATVPETPTPRSNAPIYMNAREEMRYEPLGKSRWMVSRISMGAAAFHNEDGDLVRPAMERGVNLVDTALNYGESELALARAIQPFRGDFWLSTKTPPIDAALRSMGLPPSEVPLDEPDPTREYNITNFFEDSLDSSLARLATHWIDIYSVQCAEHPETVRSPALAEAIARAKRQGKIKLAGISTIRNVRAVLDAAIDSGVFDVIIAPIHPLNITWMLPYLDRARFKGIGVIGMMSTISLPANAAELELEYDTVPEGTNAHQLAHMYVLRNAPIASLLTGMSSMERVEQNAFLGGVDTGVFMGNEIDGIVYEDFWPVCRVCGRQGHIDDKALERAYQARYRHYDTSGHLPAEKALLAPIEYLSVCAECAAGEEEG